jgi:hypothetical protein
MGEHVTDTDSGVDLKVGVCNWGNWGIARVLSKKAAGARPTMNPRPADQLHVQLWMHVHYLICAHPLFCGCH